MEQRIKGPGKENKAIAAGRPQRHLHAIAMYILFRAKAHSAGHVEEKDLLAMGTPQAQLHPHKAEPQQRTA